MMTYAGIGNRHTPLDVAELMNRLARRLSQRGWTLRSGHSGRADLAFEHGAGGRAEIYKPWASFNEDVPLIVGQCTPAIFDAPTPKAIELVRQIHPLGGHLRSGVLSLHARNAHILCGYSLREPAHFVACWSPCGSLDGENDRGGTAMALRMAKHFDIEVFNLARDDHREMCEAWLEFPSEGKLPSHEAVTQQASFSHRGESGLRP